MPKEKGDVATGTLGTLHNLSGVVGLTIGALFFNQSNTILTAAEFVTYQKVLFMFIGVIAILLFSLLMLRGRKK